MDFHFTEKAPHETGFSEFYDVEIAPVFRNMEAKRSEAIEKNRRTLILLGAAVFLFSSAAGVKVHPAFALVPLFFGGCLALVLYQDRGKHVQKELTRLLRPMLCRFLGQMTFHETVPAHYLPLDRLRQLGLLPRSDRTSLDLSVSGTWQNVKYKMTKARCVDTHKDHNDRQRHTTLFRGVVLEIDCPTNMPLVVFTRDFGESLNKLYYWAGRAHLPEHKLDLQDDRLEQIFEVYTDNPDAAAEVLGAQFAQILVDLAQEHQAGKRYVAAAFEGRKFYLALSLPHDLLNLNVAQQPLNTCNGKLRAALADLVVPRRVIDALTGA